MSGRFIAVVGPSGVGKDSVMRALAAAMPQIAVARRVITRPGDAGGEDFDGVSEERFLAMQSSGQFALSWPAHGLHYGVPVQVDDHLAAGRDVLANLSRTQLHAAQDRFDRCVFISLTATNAVLARRLTARGREDASEVIRRLERATYAVPNGIFAHEIDNSGPLEQAVTAVIALLYPESAKV